MRQIPKRLNNDGPGSMIIKDGGKPVAEMLAYTSSERDDTAAEFIERWNAFEPDGEVAQLRAENERLYLALKRCVPWMGRLIVDGGHLKCVAPNDAVGALEQAEAALGKGAA